MCASHQPHSLTTQDRFHDGVPPTACVYDLMRCRIVCSSGKGMMRLLLQLQDGFEAQLDGDVATLTLIRMKNKFLGSQLDPTRFRNVLCNLMLKARIGCFFVEIQVHHLAILEFNESQHCLLYTSPSPRD